MVLKLLPYLLFALSSAGILSFVLLAAKCKLFPQNIYLSISICSLSICTLYNAFFLAGCLKEFPEIFIIGKSVVYLIAPCTYLYLRNTFSTSKIDRKFDFLNFVPFLIILFLLANQSLRNPQDMQKALSNSSTDWLVSPSQTMTYSFLLVTRSVLPIFYGVLQCRIIVRFEMKRDVLPSRSNTKLIRWAKLFNITLTGLFSALLILQITPNNLNNINFVSDLCISAALLILLSSLFINPQILYSIEYSQSMEKSMSVSLKPDSCYNKDDSQSMKLMINPRLLSDYKGLLEKVMAEKEPFLSRRLSVADLSDLTGIPKHHLTYLISHEMNVCFSDYINIKRVEYFKDHSANPRWRLFTIDAIGNELGFNSRTTFFRAFIKLYGISPSEYIRDRKPRIQNT